MRNIDIYLYCNKLTKLTNNRHNASHNVYPNALISLKRTADEIDRRSQYDVRRYYIYEYTIDCVFVLRQ